MNDQTRNPGGYSRALRAEPRLRVIDTMVRTLATVAKNSSGVTMCSGCAWEKIVKPLALPLVGEERGFVPRSAREPVGTSWMPIDMVAVLAEREERAPAGTHAERWLRTSEAYDAVTDAWIAMLHDADPGLGHGLGTAC